MQKPNHLIVVTKGANRSKGAKGPEEWRPPDQSYWCQYATDWARVKMEWELTMTGKEADAVIEMLSACEERVEVETESVEARQQPPTPQPQAESNETTPVYGSCEEAADAGESRTQGSSGEGRGFPAEMVPSARDGDGDGVVCER